MARILSLLALAAVSLAKVHDNSVLAKTLNVKAHIFPDGDYRLVNVHTGKAQSYSKTHDSHDFAPGSKAAAVSFKQYGQGTKWTRMQLPTGKCVSAQWGNEYDGGADWVRRSFCCIADVRRPPCSTSV